MISLESYFCGMQMTVSATNFWKRNNLCCHYFVVQSTSLNFSFPPFRKWSFPAVFKTRVSFIHPYRLLFVIIRNSSPICLVLQREAAGVPEETFELKGRSLQCHCPSPVLLSSQEGLQQILCSDQLASSLSTCTKCVSHRLCSLLAIFPHFVFLYTTLIYWAVQKAMSFHKLFV